MKNRIKHFFEDGSSAGRDPRPSRAVRARVVAPGGWLARMGSVFVVLEPGTVFAIDGEIAESLTWGGHLEILPGIEGGSRP